MLGPDDTLAFPAAPAGFDVKRDGIPHGTVETVEYLQVRRHAAKLVVHLPPGYSPGPIPRVLSSAWRGWQRDGLDEEWVGRCDPRQLYADKADADDRGDAERHSGGGAHAPAAGAARHPRLAGAGGSGTGPRARQLCGQQRAVRNGSLKDIIPFIDARYSTKTDREIAPWPACRSAEDNRSTSV